MKPMTSRSGNIDSAESVAIDRHGETVIQPQRAASCAADDDVSKACHRRIVLTQP